MPRAFRRSPRHNTSAGAAVISLRSYFGRDVKLRHLRLIVAIDDAGQLSKAAVLLHMTQPALSKALAEIEAAIGEPLFTRGARGLVPNPRGTTLIRAARNILSELERVDRELRDLAARPERVLSVGVMPTAALGFVGRAIASISDQDPGLSIRVVEDLTGPLLAQLVLGRLQMVVGARLREKLPDGVQAHWLFDDPMCLVVARGHPIARRRTLGWSALSAQPWVLPAPGHPVRAVFERALQRHGLAAPHRVLEGLEIGLVMSLLEHAQAVNLMPQRLARQLQQSGLVRIVASDLAARLGIYLAVTVFVPAAPAPPADVLTLLDALRRTVSTQTDA